ncbi:hypothetical protein KR026_007393, partial [Drosophila bipectinata]
RMSSGFSFWNGQPVTAPVYPQMGDLMSQNPSGLPWRIGAGAAGAAALAGMSPGGARYFPGGFGAGQMQMQMAGMGDFRHINCPTMAMGYFGQPQPQTQYEPCLENGEAFCAYNGMDLSLQGGGAYSGSGAGAGAKGDFW